MAERTGRISKAPRVHLTYSTTCLGNSEIVIFTTLNLFKDQILGGKGHRYEFVYLVFFGLVLIGLAISNADLTR